MQALSRRWNWVRTRVYQSLSVRPWSVDIGCGLAALGWGIWVGIHNEQVAIHGGFNLFKPIIQQLSVISGVLGAAQLVVSLLKLHQARQLFALVGVILWGGIAMGLTAYSGQAAYTGYMLFDLLILTRRF